MGDISAEDIDAFITHMSTFKLSAGRRNVVIKAGTKALRWAFAKGKIKTDPTRGHTMFSVSNKKRAILNPKIAGEIFRTKWSNERAKIANMLASVTGMRSGEILALRLKDLCPDFIDVKAAWSIIDKTKTTKNNESRKVEIPFPNLLNDMYELAKKNPWGVNPESYVFWSDVNKDTPVQGRIFVNGLRAALLENGFTEEEAKKQSFHGWRHFFTSYMVKRLPKKLLKGQTGHLTDCMIDHYADHATDGERELIQSVEKDVFKGMLPEPIKIIPFRRAVNA